VDESALVTALSRGDPQTLRIAYQRYAGRLHAYAWRLLGDREAADDAVQDAFHLVGWHADELRDPHQLRSWLYAIVRHECRRRGRKTEVAPPEADGLDPLAAARSTYVTDMVRAAMATLTPEEHEIAELATRHGLSASELGAVLGVSPRRAYARSTAIRSALIAALEVLVVVPAGRCRAMRSMLIGRPAQLTPQLRRRLAKHVAACRTCAATQHELPSAVNLLAKYASLPFAAASVFLTARPAPETQPRWSRRTGFPQRPVSVTRRVLAAAAVLVIAALLTGVAMRYLGEPEADAATHNGAAPRVSATSAAAPTAAPTVEPTSESTPQPTAVETSTPGSSPPGEPRPTRSSAIVATSLTVRAAASARCGDKDRFVLDVSATAIGNLTSATLIWRAGDQRTAMMTISGGSAYAEVQSAKPRSPITWWVTVHSADGRTGTTNPVTTQHPCS